MPWPPPLGEVASRLSGDPRGPYRSALWLSAYGAAVAMSSWPDPAGIAAGIRAYMHVAERWPAHRPLALWNAGVLASCLDARTFARLAADSLAEAVEGLLEAAPGALESPDASEVERRVREALVPSPVVWRPSPRPTLVPRGRRAWERYRAAPPLVTEGSWGGVSAVLRERGWVVCEGRPPWAMVAVESRPAGFSVFRAASVRTSAVDYACVGG